MAKPERKPNGVAAPGSSEQCRATASNQASGTPLARESPCSSRPSAPSPGIAAGSCATSTSAVPIHITGATAGSASRLAGRPINGTAPKLWASSGAVASVAAMVSASASANGRGSTRASERVKPGRERDEPDDGGEGELPAGVAADARVERQRDGGGEQQRVDPRRRATGSDRDEPRGAHHPGALERRRRSGERNVERDQGDRREQPGTVAESGEPEQRQCERREQHHVLAARGEQV